MLLTPSSFGSSVPSDFGSGPVANIDYVAARANSLWVNGLGELTNNYNFPDFVFDPVISPNVKGSFRRDGYYAGALFSSEVIGVDPSAVYEMSVDFLQETHPSMTGSGHKQYVGLVCVDVDGLSITPVYTVSHTNGGISSRTTLAAPLTPGDMSMTLTDASGWDNSAGTLDYKRGVIIWEYKNSYGFKYTHYSRLRVINQWDPGGVDVGTGVVTFNKPFPGGVMANPDDVGGTWPIGTELSNPASGGTYKYVASSGYATTLPDTWYRATGFIGGIDKSGLNFNLNFAPGTAFIRPMFLANYTNRVGGYSGFPDTGPDHSVYFAKCSFIRLRNDTITTRNANGRVDFKVPSPNDTTNIIDLIAPARTLVEEV